MDDLVQWLRAQLDEDERIARAACEGAEGRWHPLGNQHGGSVAGDHDGYHVACDEGYPTVEQATHIAEHDPARVLREIDAKRQIIEQHERYAAERRRMMAGWDPQSDDSPILAALASVYADRPGYRAEWKP
ncbi:DUF6221 family protein [Streptomyces turgidiscabies]|uniref:DUF6221 family protein n=1 Tax=Streptomyces turgidiscabies TaxID=85558 RepID=UPI0038F62025